MRPSDRSDEGLELLYQLRERGIADEATFVRECAESDPQGLLRELAAQGSIERSAGEVLLTESGSRRAAEVIRRHRLAEVLMHTVLQVAESEAEQTACLFEHILSEDACDRVCAFLGHPTHCPHGRAIPAGRCCEARETDDRVQPLAEMQVGDICEVVHIRSRHHTRLDRLGAYGLVPGTVVRLHQKRPSFVVQVDATDLALDADVARDIYVRQKD